MQTKYEKMFLREAEKLPKDIRILLADILLDIGALLWQDIHKRYACKRMQGSSKNAWRIRMGNYRIGIIYDDDDTLRFVRVRHRKDIYRYFP